MDILLMIFYTLFIFVSIITIVVIGLYSIWESVLRIKDKDPDDYIFK